MAYFPIFQDFVDLLSAAGQVTMRRLDVVTVKGSEVPTGIYTYDALQDQVFLEDKQQCKQQVRGYSVLILLDMHISHVTLIY